MHKDLLNKTLWQSIEPQLLSQEKRHFRFRYIKNPFIVSLVVVIFLFIPLYFGTKALSLETEVYYLLMDWL